MTTAQDLFELAGQPESIVDALNASSFDELVEIDLLNNRTRNLFHVEGKYHVPIFDGSYKDLYRYANDHMVHPDDQETHKRFMDYDTIEQRLEESAIPGVLSTEFRYRLQNDDWRWVKQVVIGGKRFGLPEGVIHFYVFDIQNRKEREQGLVSSGVHKTTGIRDTLTGLMREKDFFAEAHEYLGTKSFDGWCLVAMDIDQFKLFNDWYGREAGDFVLANIGAYFNRRSASDGWLSGYLGQDDFCVFMPYDEHVIDQLYDDISSIIADFGASMTFTPIIGACMVEEATATLDLLDRARLAMEAAKGDFRHPMRMFDPDMFRETEAEYRLLTDFQQAIANHEIYYVVQPQCRISTGKIVGVEALARWRKQDGDIIQPDVFVPVLEKYGFITDLDRYIWEEVCKHVKKWLASGNKPVPVSMNVSKQDIYAFDVAEHFENLIRTYDLPPSLIKIEITESAYVDDSRKVRETVRRLREKGFLVLMDDFGSGFSSLNMLDSLNVDVIKLDMRFLQMNESTKRKGIHILESVVNMAKTLDLLVITEGVETAEQADFLRSIGCRYVQGYYFYRPMTNEDFEQLIANKDVIDEAGFVFKSNEEFRIREFLDYNVYSDSMLNNILGAVTQFSWHAEGVDIIRFNEQFYEETGVGDDNDLLKGIHRRVDPNYVSTFFDLLMDAIEDELNGASGVVRFRRHTGEPLDLLVHFYYMGEEGETRRFFGSVHNITQLTELRDEMTLLSVAADISVSFLSKHSEGWRFKVGVHGIEDELGLSHADLQRELDDGSFFKRLEPEAAQTLFSLMEAGNNPKDDFVMPLGIRTDDGTVVPMVLKCYCVTDDRSSFSYVIVLGHDRER